MHVYLKALNNYVLGCSNKLILGLIHLVGLKTNCYEFHIGFSFPYMSPLSFSLKRRKICNFREGWLTLKLWQDIAKKVQHCCLPFKFNTWIVFISK